MSSTFVPYLIERNYINLSRMENYVVSPYWLIFFIDQENLMATKIDCLIYC